MKQWNSTQEPSSFEWIYYSNVPPSLTHGNFNFYYRFSERSIILLELDNIICLYCLKPSIKDVKTIFKRLENYHKVTNTTNPKRPTRFCYLYVLVLSKLTTWLFDLHYGNVLSPKKYPVRYIIWILLSENNWNIKSKFFQGNISNAVSDHIVKFSQW